MEEKLYYKIGEISKIVQIETSVLRFWESEFKKIKPRRTTTGQRIYSKKDLNLILEIKRLLYDKKFTIEGAKQHLRLKKDDIPQNIFYELRNELQQIKKLLQDETLE